MGHMVSETGMDAGGTGRAEPRAAGAADGAGLAGAHSSPRAEIRIVILDDGRVLFGDLTPALAEVARTLQGVASEAAR